MSDEKSSLIPQNQAAPSPDDLVAFVPYACSQLSAPFTVRIKTEVQEEYVRKAEDKNKKRKSNIVLTQMPISDSIENSMAAMATNVSSDSDEIVIMAALDTSDRLVGLALDRCAKTPRLLIQVIGLCIPFCPFLTSLSLQFSRLGGTVLYEIAKFLPQSQITDLCLDDSPIVPAERCYYRLLEQSTKLRILSLARCSLSDDDCALLVSKLTFPLPASKTLIILNLTNNFISDVGARAIGDCLRTNRKLQYLNLAGNQIGDRGTAAIINSLADFPLTADEILTKRQRYMEFLKMRRDAFINFCKEMGTAVIEKPLDDSSRSPKRRGGDVKPAAISLQRGKRGSRDDVVARAQMLADGLVGNYLDPFSSDETFLRDNYRYCIGNMSLCYLNLAYNNVSYLSLKKLIQVVKYQSTVSKSYGVGLLQIQLQGNDMPDCLEMYILQDWLEEAVLSRTAPPMSQRRIKTKK